jgi:hypothetical protein
MASATLEVAPTQWANLKDIHEVEPINEGDLDCLAEVRNVLKKHGKQERFGIALLHKHFDMEADEILLEESDVEGRVLTVKPVKRTLAGNTIETIWQLMDGEHHLMMGCRQYCSESEFSKHRSFHDKT